MTSLAVSPDFSLLDASVARRLPFAFARDHAVLAARQVETNAGTALELWIAPQSNLSVIGEIMRQHGPVSLQTVSNEVLQQAL